METNDGAKAANELFEAIKNTKAGTQGFQEAANNAKKILDAKLKVTNRKEGYLNGKKVIATRTAVGLVMIQWEDFNEIDNFFNQIK